MGMRKLWVTLAALAAFAMAVFTGCDSPTGGGGGGGAILPITFTVTFDSAGGSAVTSQNVAQNGLVQEPSTTRAWVATAGLWAGTLVTQYTLVEWRHNDAAWDFATPVTANITLTASWTAPVNTLVEGVAANNIAAAIAHVNAYDGEFTLAISQDVNSGENVLSRPDTSLTIVGIGEPREIRLNASGGLFLVEPTGTGTTNTLILGNYITLVGRDQGQQLVRTRHGARLYMYPGSKITGHTNSGDSDPNGIGAAVQVGANSTFTMRGGTITGNRATGTTVVPEGSGAGGVLVFDATSVFNMEGGSISGNFRGTGADEVPADVFVSATVEDFTVSGNATIGRLILDATTTANAFITVGSGWTGNVHNLDLRSNASVSTVTGRWLNNTVLEAVNNQTLTAAKGRVGSTAIRILGNTPAAVSEDISGTVGFISESNANYAELQMSTTHEVGSGQVVITFTNLPAEFVDEVDDSEVEFRLHTTGWMNLDAKGVGSIQGNQITFYLYVASDNVMTATPFTTAGRFYMGMWNPTAGVGIDQTFFEDMVNITEGRQSIAFNNALWVWWRD